MKKFISYSKAFRVTRERSNSKNSSDSKDSGGDVSVDGSFTFSHQQQASSRLTSKGPSGDSGSDPIDITNYSLDDTTIKSLLELLEVICRRTEVGDEIFSQTISRSTLKQTMLSDETRTIGECLASGIASNAYLSQRPLISLLASLFQLLTEIKCREVSDMKIPGGLKVSANCLMHDNFLKAVLDSSRKKLQDDDESGLMQIVSTNFDVPQQRLLGALFAACDFIFTSSPNWFLDILAKFFFAAVTIEGRNASNEINSDNVTSREFMAERISAFCIVAAKSRLLFPFYFIFFRRLVMNTSLTSSLHLNLTGQEGPISLQQWQEAIAGTAASIHASLVDAGKHQLATRQSTHQLINASKQHDLSDSSHFNQSMPMAILESSSPSKVTARKAATISIGNIADVRHSLDNSISKLSQLQTSATFNASDLDLTRRSTSSTVVGNMKVVGRLHFTSSRNVHSEEEDALDLEHSENFGPTGRGEESYSDTSLVSKDIINVSSFNESRSYSNLASSRGGAPSVKGTAQLINDSSKNKNNELGIGIAGRRDRYLSNKNGGDEEFEESDEFKIDEGPNQAKDKSMTSGWQTATRSPTQAHKPHRQINKNVTEDQLGALKEPETYLASPKTITLHELHEVFAKCEPSSNATIPADDLDGRIADITLLSQYLRWSYKSPELSDAVLSLKSKGPMSGGISFQRLHHLSQPYLKPESATILTLKKAGSPSDNKISTQISHEHVSTVDNTSLMNLDIIASSPRGNKFYDNSENENSMNNATNSLSMIATRTRTIGRSSDLDIDISEIFRPSGIKGSNVISTAAGDGGDTARLQLKAAKSLPSSPNHSYEGPTLNKVDCTKESGRCRLPYLAGNASILSVQHLSDDEEFNSKIFDDSILPIARLDSYQGKNNEIEPVEDTRDCSLLSMSEIPTVANHDRRSGNSPHLKQNPLQQKASESPISKHRIGGMFSLTAIDTSQSGEDDSRTLQNSPEKIISDSPTAIGQMNSRVNESASLISQTKNNPAQRCNGHDNFDHNINQHFPNPSNRNIPVSTTNHTEDIPRDIANSESCSKIQPALQGIAVGVPMELEGTSSNPNFTLKSFANSIIGLTRRRSTSNTEAVDKEIVKMNGFNDATIYSKFIGRQRSNSDSSSRGYDHPVDSGPLPLPSSIPSGRPRVISDENVTKPLNSINLAGKDTCDNYSGNSSKTGEDMSTRMHSDKDYNGLSSETASVASDDTSNGRRKKLSMRGIAKGAWQKIKRLSGTKQHPDVPLVTVDNLERINDRCVTGDTIQYNVDHQVDLENCKKFGSYPPSSEVLDQLSDKNQVGKKLPRKDFEADKENVYLTQAEAPASAGKRNGTGLSSKIRQSVFIDLANSNKDKDTDSSTSSMMSSACPSPFAASTDLSRLQTALKQASLIHSSNTQMSTLNPGPRNISGKYGPSHQLNNDVDWRTLFVDQLTATSNFLQHVRESCDDRDAFLNESRLFLHRMTTEMAVLSPSPEHKNQVLLDSKSANIDVLTRASEGLLLFGGITPPGFYANLANEQTRMKSNAAQNVLIPPMPSEIAAISGIPLEGFLQKKNDRGLWKNKYMTLSGRNALETAQAQAQGLAIQKKLSSSLIRLNIFDSCVESCWGIIPTKFKQSVMVSDIVHVSINTDSRKDSSSSEFYVTYCPKVFAEGSTVPFSFERTISLRAKSTEDRMIWVGWIHAAMAHP